MESRKSVAEGEYAGHQPLALASGPLARIRNTAAPVAEVIANLCSMNIPPLELYEAIIKRFHWCHKMLGKSK